MSVRDGLLEGLISDCGLEVALFVLPPVARVYSFLGSCISAPPPAPAMLAPTSLIVSSNNLLAMLDRIVAVPANLRNIRSF